MKSHPLHNKLVGAVTRLHRETSSPFGTVVAESLRTIGVPVTDPEPPEGIRVEVAEAVNLYCEAAVQAPPFSDILGPVFEEVGSRGGKQMSGQFFTPWDVCYMMAQMQLSDWNPEQRPDGELWSVHEPACGSGAMLLACLAYLAKEHGPGVLRMWSLHAIDLDLTLARTCALQILVGLSAVPAPIGRLEVWHGNSLSMEMRSCVVRARANPMLAVLGIMDRVLEALDGSEQRTPGNPQEQLPLFDEEAA